MKAEMFTAQCPHCKSENTTLLSLTEDDPWLWGIQFRGVLECKECHQVFDKVEFYNDGSTPIDEVGWILDEDGKLFKKKAGQADGG